MALQNCYLIPQSSRNLKEMVVILIHCFYFIIIIIFFKSSSEERLDCGEIIRFTWWTSDVVHNSTKKLSHV